MRGYLEKRALVQAVLGAHPEWTNARLAREAGVSRPTIIAERKRLAADLLVSAASPSLNEMLRAVAMLTDEELVESVQATRNAVVTAAAVEKRVLPVLQRYVQALRARQKGDKHAEHDG